MSSKKMTESFPARSIVTLICVAGLALFSAWLLSTPGLKASSSLPSLTSQVRSATLNLSPQDG